MSKTITLQQRDYWYTQNGIYCTDNYEFHAKTDTRMFTLGDGGYAALMYPDMVGELVPLSELEYEKDMGTVTFKLLGGME